MDTKELCQENMTRAMSGFQKPSDYCLIVMWKANLSASVVSQFGARSGKAEEVSKNQSL